MSVSDAAHAAARWWAARLRDNPTIHDDVRTRFDELLRNEIVRLIEGEPNTLIRDRSGFDDGGPRVKLRVDYQPDEVLFRALDGSSALDIMDDYDVHLAMMLRPPLPQKTTMTVSARRVIVSHGYGAPWVEIWGPAWGATYEEQRRADAYRMDAQEPVFEAWIDARPRWDLMDWVGCVPEERKQ